MQARNCAGRVLMGIVFFIAAAVVFGLVVMLLWNALIPPLFGGPMLNYWQALGLLILAKILFKGIGPGHCGPPWKRHDWRNRFEEKLAAMTPEEREQFRHKWGGVCGWSSDDKSKSEN